MLSFITSAMSSMAERLGSRITTLQEGLFGRQNKWIFDIGISCVASWPRVLLLDSYENQNWQSAALLSVLMSQDDTG